MPVHPYFRTTPPRKAPQHLPKNHPVRVLLSMAVADDLPSALLSSHLDGWDADLPEGHNLSRFRGDVNRAAAKVRAQAATGDLGAARRTADDLAAQIAADMTDAERAADGDPSATEEDVRDIAARMFSR